jgi:hypothetical protein
VSPIEAVAGVSAYPAALDKKEGPVSVVLNFMDPSCSRRGMIDGRCELRVDELQRHASHLPEPQEIGSPACSGEGLVGTRVVMDSARPMSWKGEMMNNIADRERSAQDAIRALQN